MVRLLPVQRHIERVTRDCFNPTMVRLLPVEPKPKTCIRCGVSIPQWCDCCCLTLALALWLCDCFNPTMVRLLQATLTIEALSACCFNPTMVRLLLGPTQLMEFALVAFQSHNGAIAARRHRLDSRAALSGFNPTMVRLLRLRHLRRVSVVSCFNPTMVRLLLSNGAGVRGSIKGFNPTMVRLLPKRRCLDNVGKSSFNPTMVRLLPSLVEFFEFNSEMFQSHNGAIAAGRSMCSTRCYNLKFQSHHGAIAALSN